MTRKDAEMKAEIMTETTGLPHIAISDSPTPSNLQGWQVELDVGFEWFKSICQEQRQGISVN